MRPDCVVVLAPFLDEHFGLIERIEDLTVEQFISEGAARAATQPLKISL
jgi:hypothetical protein